MLLYCITGLPRVKIIGCRYVVIDQFTHLLLIFLEYGATQEIYLASGEMFSVLEKLTVISSDRDKLSFLISKIKYGIGFIRRHLTQILMQTTIHGGEFSPYSISVWISRIGGERRGMKIEWL